MTPSTRDVLRFPGRKICARIVPHRHGGALHEPEAIQRENDGVYFDAYDHRNRETYTILGHFLRLVLRRYYDYPDAQIAMMRADPTFEVRIPNYTYRAQRTQQQDGVA